MDLNTDAAAIAREDGRRRPDGGSEASPIAVAPAPAGERPLGAREAARNLASWRHNRDKRDQDGEQRQTSAPVPAKAGIAGAAAAPHEPVKEASFAEATEDTGERPGLDPRASPPSETEGADREGDLPPIEPPRSWTKEDKELFTSLPRETQERLAERERSREGDFSRRQQEATEHRNALAAERLMAEQTRQRYETALPLLLNGLQQQQGGEFADIKTLADLERLAGEDRPRYLRWELQQRNIAAVAQQLAASQEHRASEHRQQFSEFAQRQNELFKEKVPEMADSGAAAKLQEAAVSALKDVGFTDPELVAYWNGGQTMSLRDHRLLLLVRDAVHWRDAQQKAKAATAKPVPPVQRPGVSQPRGAAHDVQVQNLTKRLETSGSLKDAAALLRARRSARH